MQVFFLLETLPTLIMSWIRALHFSHSPPEVTISWTPVSYPFSFFFALLAFLKSYLHLDPDRVPCMAPYHAVTDHMWKEC